MSISTLDSKIIYATKGTTLDKNIRDPVLLGTIMGEAHHLNAKFDSIADDELKKRYPSDNKISEHPSNILWKFSEFYRKKLPQNRKLLVTNFKVHECDKYSSVISIEFYSVKVDKTE